MYKKEDFLKKISICLLMFLPFMAIAQTGMLLDGNSYLTSRVKEDTNYFANASFTMECWVKSPSAPTTIGGYSGPVYGNIMGIYWNHQNSLYAGAGAVMDANGTFNRAGFGPLIGNAWYHLALTYDGDSLKTFTNGKLIEAVKTGGGLSFTNGLDLKIGKHVTQSYYFAGNLDEIRIWNLARTPAEIAANMSSSLTSGNGLLASYTFEEGVPLGNNTALAYATDHSGNGNHADFTQVLRYGSASNYAGSVSNLFPPTNASLYTGNALGSLNTPLALRSADFTELTIEAWVKGAEVPANNGQYTGPIYGHAAALNWHHNNAQFRGAASIQNVAGTFYAASFGTINANTWYHLAMTYDGTNLKAYKNGVLISTTAAPGGILDYGSTLQIAEHPSVHHIFNGYVDEIRIWNVARSCSDINSLMNEHVETPQSGLVLNYGFNNRYQEGVNAPNFTEPDLSGSGNDGTYSNYNLLGVTENFAAEGPMNATAQTPTITIQPQDVQSCGSAVSIACHIAFGTYTYQWQMDDGSGYVDIGNSADYNIITGTTGSTVQILNPQLAMNGYKYRCLTTSSGICGGTTTSRGATLNVGTTPVLNVAGPTQACVGQTLSLTASGADTYSWSNGDNTDVAMINSSTAGTFNYTLTGTSNGCTTNHNFSLTFLATDSRTDVVSICAGSTYTYPDNTLGSISETHISSFLNANGCDSIIVTELTVLAPLSQSLDVHICSGQVYTFPDNTTATASTTNTTVLSSVNGCDSTIITNLFVDQPFNTSETVNVCAGTTYTFPDGSTGSGNMTHTSVLSSVAGCDSTVVTTLNEMPQFNMAVGVSICDGELYTFPDGAVSGISQTHVSQLQSISGCDSTITTTLTVFPGYHASETVEICQGSTYVFPDGAVPANTQAGTLVHISQFQSLHGCDSLVTTTLNILPPSTAFETVEICEGSAYQFPDGAMPTNTQAGTIMHTSLLQNANGCDSLLTTTLIIHPASNSSEQVTLCFGDSYTYPDGSEFVGNLPGISTYNSVFNTGTGCDSTITTEITVLEAIMPVITQNGNQLSITENGTITWFECSGGSLIPIVGQNGNTFDPSASGSYAVEVNDGFCSGVSACFNFTEVGISEINQEGIRLYPNPSDGLVTIENPSGKNQELVVLDQTGKMVYQQKIQKTHTIDLGAIAKGVYQVKLISTDGTTTAMLFLK